MDIRFLTEKSFVCRISEREIVDILRIPSVERLNEDRYSNFLTEVVLEVYKQVVEDIDIEELQYEVLFESMENGTNDVVGIFIEDQDKAEWIDLIDELEFTYDDGYEGNLDTGADLKNYEVTGTFDDMESVMKLCEVINNPIIKNSTLYKYKYKYYLSITLRKNAKEKEIAVLIYRISEYGNLNETINKEQGKILVENNAIDVLSDLNGGHI